MKRIKPHEGDEPRRQSPHSYEVEAFIVAYSVREGPDEPCRSMMFNVRTSLGEQYKNIWYPTGLYGKSNLYRKDRKPTGIKGFLERCLIENLEAFNDSDVELASAWEPVTFCLRYPYVPDGKSHSAASDAPEEQLEFPLSEGQVLPFVRRPKKTEAGVDGQRR